MKNDITHEEIVPPIWVIGLLTGPDQITMIGDDGVMDDTIYFIDPVTLGQCTGVKSRANQDRLAFEGDLIKFECDVIGVVVFESCKLIIDYPFAEPGSRWFQAKEDVIKLSTCDWDIIGNVTDNPESLEQGGQHE